jgi:hypothetical protein
MDNSSIQKLEKLIKKVNELEALVRRKAANTSYDVSGIKNDIAKLKAAQAEVEKLLAAIGELDKVCATARNQVLEMAGMRADTVSIIPLTSDDVNPFPRVACHWGVMLAPHSPQMTFACTYNRDAGANSNYHMSAALFNEQIDVSSSIPVGVPDDDYYQLRPERKEITLVNAFAFSYSDGIVTLEIIGSNQYMSKEIPIDVTKFNTIVIAHDSVVSDETDFEWGYSVDQIVANIYEFDIDYADGAIVPKMKFSRRTVGLSGFGHVWPSHVDWDYEANITPHELIGPLLFTEGGFGALEATADSEPKLTDYLHGIMHDSNLVLIDYTHRVTKALIDEAIVNANALTLETGLGDILSTHANALTALNSTAVQAKSFELNELTLEEQKRVIVYDGPNRECITKMVDVGQSAIAFNGTDTHTISVNARDLFPTDTPFATSFASRDASIHLSWEFDNTPFSVHPEATVDYSYVDQIDPYRVTRFRVEQFDVREQRDVSLKVAVELDAWVGSNASATDTSIEYEVQRLPIGQGAAVGDSSWEAHTWNGEPEIYNISGKLAWIFKIPIGVHQWALTKDYQTYTDRAHSENPMAEMSFDAAWPDVKGDFKVRFYKPASEAQMTCQIIPEASPDLRVKTDDLGQYPGGYKSENLCNMSPSSVDSGFQVRLKAVRGTFNYLRDPLGTRATFVNLYDEFQDGEISILSYDQDKLKEDMLNSEKRLDEIESQVFKKQSALLIIGNLVLGVAGFLPVGKAIMAAMVVGTALVAADAAQNGDALAVFNSIVQGVVGFIGVAHAQYKSVNAETMNQYLTDFQAKLKHLADPLASIPRGMRQFARSMKTRLAFGRTDKPVNVDPDSLRWVENEGYMPMAEALRDNYVAVYQSRLAKTSDKWWAAGEQGAKGTRAWLYRKLLKHHVAPTHSLVKGCCSWPVVEWDDIAVVGIAYRFGVGEGYATSIPNVGVTKSLDIDGYSPGAAIAPFKLRNDDDPDVEPLFLDPQHPNVTEEMLRNEAAYYWRAANGRENLAGLRVWLDSEPWNAPNRDPVYTRGWRSNQIMTTKFEGERLDPSTVVPITHTPESIGMISNYLAADRADGGIQDTFKYDLVANNCHDVAYNIHAIMTGRKPRRTPSALSDLSSPQYQRLSGMIASTPDAMFSIDRVYQMLGSHFIEANRFSWQSPPFSVDFGVTDARNFENSDLRLLKLYCRKN